MFIQTSKLRGKAFLLVNITCTSLFLIYWLITKKMGPQRIHGTVPTSQYGAAIPTTFSSQVTREIAAISRELLMRSLGSAGLDTKSQRLAADALAIHASVFTKGSAEDYLCLMNMTHLSPSKSYSSATMHDWDERWMRDNELLRDVKPRWNEAHIEIVSSLARAKAPFARHLSAKGLQFQTGSHDQSDPFGINLKLVDTVLVEAWVPATFKRRHAPGTFDGFFFSSTWATNF